MSYYDKKFGSTLPTRHGAAPGAANERQMLDRLGGSEGYRKKIRLNPDGSTTMLTTKNGMPQFITSAATTPAADDGNLFLGMDSGALQATKSTAVTYTRTSKNKIPQNEKAEFVHWIDNSLTGRQPFDNSTTDAVGNNSDLLRGCPASMFTGRMRLYVQCLYGRLTSEKNAAGQTITNPPPDVALFETFGAAPAITINNLLVDTSTGIYFDHLTVTHYLVCITTGKAYKLKRTVNVDRLVALIQAKDVADERKAKAEAYILAHSVPDTSKVTPLELPERPASALGYGWHFDWTGRQCDLVQVDSGALSNLSTHHTVRISLVNGTITTKHTKEVSAPWKNKKLFQVIGVPLWDLSGYIRLGQQFADSDTDGIATPFYVYHRHNTTSFPGSSEIVLCKFSANPGTKPPIIKTREPWYFNPGSSWTLGDDRIEYVTNGTSTTSDIALSGGSEKTMVQSYSSGNTTKASQPVTTTKAVGAVTWYGMMSFASSTTAQTGRPVGPTMMSDIGTEFGTISVYGGAGSVEDFSNYAHITYDFSGASGAPGVIQAATNFPAAWTTEYTSDNVAEKVKTIAVPPYYDAEAMVYYMQIVKQRTRTGVSYDCAGQGYERPWGHAWLDAGPAYALANTYHTYMELLSGASTVSSSAVNTTDTNTETWARAMGSFGVEPVAMPDVGKFFNSTPDPVPSYIGLRSSCAKSVYSAELSLNIGNTPAAFAGKWLSYVGWA